MMVLGIFMGGLVVGLILGWLLAQRVHHSVADTTDSMLELLRQKEAEAVERQQAMISR